MRRMDAGLNKIHLGAMTGGRKSTPRKAIGSTTTIGTRKSPRGPSPDSSGNV
jgi:hypothetical protein